MARPRLRIVFVDESLLVVQHFHATDLTKFLECRRAFKYSKIWRIKSDSEKEYFDIGKKGHRVLQAHYSKEDPYEILNSIENSEHKQLLKVLYEGYLPTYPNDFQLWDIASIENELTITLEGIELIFTIDVLALIHSIGRYGVIDHKFYDKLPNERVLDNDFQASFYLWAANKLGFKVYDYILNVIRKSPAMPPQPLKNGSLSKSKTALSQTTYELYLDAINGLGLREEDYISELKALNDRGSIVYKRYETSRTPTQLANFEINLRAILKEIHNQNTVFYPSPSRNCPYCEFKFLCAVEDSGGDTEYTSKSMYKLKQVDER